MRNSRVHSEEKFKRNTPKFEFSDPEETKKALHYLANISNRLETLNGTLASMKKENNALK